MKIDKLKIVDFLSSNNMTYDEFAKECGVTYNTVNRWINSDINISKRNVAAIAMVIQAYEKKETANCLLDSCPARPNATGEFNGVLIDLLQSIKRMDREQHISLLQEAEKLLKK